ncbi:hypothetical protein BT69DRAFT_1284041 [Atractiella rhizophila]|nr:hypothetical protein BT69DRAFT_1284041 [Atractiella rhizophila]
MLLKFQYINSEMLQALTCTFSRTLMVAIRVSKVNQADPAILPHRNIRVGNIPMLDSALVQLDNDIVDPLVDFAV